MADEPYVYLDIFMLVPCSGGWAVEEPTPGGLKRHGWLRTRECAERVAYGVLRHRERVAAGEQIPAASENTARTIRQNRTRRP